MDRVEHDLSDKQWTALKVAWGGGCAYCGASGTLLHRDCVLPLSRGGRYTLENIVPACSSCNTSKWNDVEIRAALGLRFPQTGRVR
jgi:5-methylcytosine-specific restriction endonuclease McrA